MGGNSHPLILKEGDNMEKIVYNDIDESTYLFSYNDMVFYFSSNFYKEKFENEYISFIKEETDKLRLKFKCNIEADYMILLLLYKKIEKRGFRVEYKNIRLSDGYFVFTFIDES